MYITDRNGNAVGSEWYSGTTLAGQTLIVPGDIVNLRLNTDGSVVRYGFKFDEIRAINSVNMDTPVISSVKQPTATSILISFDPALQNEQQIFQLYRKDGNGSYTQIYAGTEQNYTDANVTPGHTYTYRLRIQTIFDSVTLYSAYSEEVTYTAFDIPTDPYPETAHPYANHSDINWTYTIPGASKLEIKFNASSAFESGYDYLYITDHDGNNVGQSSYSGTSLASKVLTVPGDTVNIRFHSDGSNTKYGFSIDYITPIA